MDLMSVYLMSMSVLMVVIVLVIPKGMFVYKTVCNSLETRRLPFSSAIKCYIPLYNNIILMRVLYDVYKTQLVISILSTIIIIAKVLQSVYYANSKLVNLVSVMVVFITIFTILINEITITYKFAKKFDGGSWTMLFSVVCVPIANLFMAWTVDAYFRKHSDEIRDVFNG